MDKDFQTSFIPKKPLAEEKITRRKPASLVYFVAVALFIVSILSAGGVYFYKVTLESSIKNMDSSLTKARSSFEPSFLDNVQNLDRRINSAREILSQHVMVSPIFEALQTLTLRTVRFTKF